MIRRTRGANSPRTTTRTLVDCQSLINSSVPASKKGIVEYSVGAVAQFMPLT